YRIARVLGVHDRLVGGLRVGEVVDHLLEKLGPLHEVLGAPRELVEERIFAGDELQSHAILRSHGKAARILPAADALRKSVEPKPRWLLDELVAQAPNRLDVLGLP